MSYHDETKVYNFVRNLEAISSALHLDPNPLLFNSCKSILIISIPSILDLMFELEER